MKTRFLSVLFKRTIFLLLVISSFSLQAAVWVGASTSDVIDQDLFIDGSGGDILLPAGPRLVQALSVNVTVTLAADPVIVGNDGAPGSQLLLCAQNGNTVTVILGDAADQDLVFNGGTTRRLVVTVDTDSSAGSEVIFQIAGNRTVRFTSSGAGAGTDVYVIMNGPDAGNIPTLTFERASTSDARNVQIVVGNKSRVAGINLTATTLNGVNGAAALAATREGLIVFDGTNTAVGRMVLDVQNGGTYIIEGTELPVVTAKNDVNDATILANATGQPAGRLMTTRVVSTNPVANSSLLILSGNQVLGAIQADPFCQNNFNFFNRLGVVLGGFGLLDITANTFVDYVGLALNSCPAIVSIPTLPGVDPKTVIKAHNGSAFLIDGNTSSTAQHAQVNLAATSAWVFRSGIGNDGTITSTGAFPYTIDPVETTPGAGNYVLDVEAPVQITGASLNTKLEILSLFVEPTGGPVLPGSAETNFPIRTFATDSNGDLIRYNSAAFFINNNMTLFGTVLEHTDENHEVLQENDVQSEPTYVGGERFTIKHESRPCMQFVNSAFQIRTSVAVTGVDLCVPTYFTGGICIDNTSNFIFYTNGKRVDNQTGRSLILGTQVGSKACDGCTIISKDAHLDVIQTTSCDANAANELELLNLDAGLNSPQVNNQITTDITGQTSIHTIYLGNASNISVGSQSNGFANKTNPTLCINGNYFSFTTRGGSDCRPDASNVTGQGGIFVDQNGLFKINPNFRASVAAMVTKSSTGIIDLPKEQVLFRYHIGIADWQPNFAVTTTLIPEGECLSDYTLNWIEATKDYNVFCPYDLGSVNICTCPAVTTSNVSGIPIVAGEVNQFQIQGSRIGDPAHLKVNGGWIRELVFLSEGYSAEAPTAVLVVENNGRVGLGTAHRNVDSLNASVMLGVNGINIIANGEGQIDLNEDILVNNICAFLKGPDFADQNVLRISSDVEREFRVRPSGVLDFSHFTAGDVVEFGGEIKVILEGGATIINNGGATIRFNDNAQLYAEPYYKSQDIFEAIVEGPIDNTLDPIATVTNPALPHNQYAPLANFGAGLQNTDSFRVRLIGDGTLLFDGESRFVIPQFAYVGVESLYEVRGTTTCEIDTTVFTIALQGAGQFIVGGLNELPGGSFQVGNTVNRAGHNVSLVLLCANRDVQARVNAEGFLGLGVGIVDKRVPIPNDWLVDTLFNVQDIFLRVDDGLFIHDRTFTGSDGNASLLAIAEYNANTPAYTLVIENAATVEQDRANAAGVHGGGNMVLIQQSGNAGALHPVVLNFDGNVLTPPNGVVSPRLQTALFSSRPLLEDDDQVGVGASVLFAFVKVKDHLTDVGRNAGRGTAALFEDNSALFDNPLRVGWVDTLTLGRQDVFDIADALGGDQKDRRIKAADSGAVSIQVEGSAPGQVTFAQQLPS